MSDHPALFKLSLYEVGLLAEATGRTNQDVMDGQMVKRCEHGKIDPHFVTAHIVDWALAYLDDVPRCPGSPTLNNKGEDE